MQTIGSLFQVLNQGLPIDLILLVLFIYMLFKMNSMSKDIGRIDQKLDNHITDTNKKIDSLKNDMNTKIEKLSDRFEKLSDRFDRLYEILIKDKK